MRCKSNTSENLTYTPVGSVVPLLEVSLQPTMSICLLLARQHARLHPKTPGFAFASQTYGVQEVHLAPFKIARRPVRSIGDARLHALDVPDMLDVICRAIAAVTREGGRDEAHRGDQTGNSAEALHLGAVQSAHNRVSSVTTQEHPRESQEG